MGIMVASTDLPDEQFLEAVRTASLKPAQFRHGDHLRLAWLYLHRLPLPEAERTVQLSIRHFADSHGASHIYHETVTLAWVRLLATHVETSFAEFLQANEWRLNVSLLYQFWTPDLLASDQARKNWVPPDLRPLPA
jgi:hypothetical protein